MFTTLALLATGAIAGTLGALLGLGGGIFLVPALTLVFHLPIRIAIGTSLVGVIATSAGVAVTATKGHNANVSLALRLELATTAGAVMGSLLAGHLSARILSLLFAAVVFFTAGYTWRKTRHRRIAQGRTSGESLLQGDYEAHHWPAGLGLAGIAGTLSGLVGVGGGFIKVPIMYALMGVPLGIATATSNFMVGITAGASVFVYYARGDVYPLVTVPTVMGVFIGAVGGGWLAPRLRVAWLEQSLILLLLAMGVQMLLEGVGIHVMP